MGWLSPEPHRVRELKGCLYILRLIGLLLASRRLSHQALPPEGYPHQSYEM